MLSTTIKAPRKVQTWQKIASTKRSLSFALFFSHIQPNNADNATFELIFSQFMSNIFFHLMTTPGLPDGIFSDQKQEFGKILEGLAMEDVSICYRHLVYFTGI
jgi:hypothetical protein